MLNNERYALAAAQGVSVDRAKLSATFATMSDVATDNVPAAIEALSCQVLEQKARRDTTLSEAIATALTGTPDPICEQCGAPAFASVSRRLLCRNCYQGGV